MQATPMEPIMDCCESPTSSRTSRRSLLLGGASFAAWAYLPKFARAADGRDPRLVVVILRGALDGFATVAPVGDPDYAALHGAIALAAEGAHPAIMLDSFFALHPSMVEFARMYRDKQAAVVAVDENTSFRKRKEDVTLADIKVGDFISAEGGLHNGSFLATTLRIMPPRTQPGPPVHP